MRVHGMRVWEMHKLDKREKKRTKAISRPVLALMICKLLMLSLVISLFSTFVLKGDAYAIGYVASGDMLIELQIAKSAPTRIQIDGEKITDIFVHPQSAIEAVIHPSGCLVVLPQEGEEKVFVTVFGENETVQDLSLRFVQKNPSPIRLIKFSLESDLANQKSFESINSPNEEDDKFLTRNDQKTKNKAQINNKK